MTTLADVEASVRAATDQDVSGPVTQVTIYQFVNEELPSLRRRLGDLVPDLYTAYTADFTVAAGVYSVDLSAAPISLTDFGKVRTVERKESGQYYPLSVAPALGPGTLDPAVAGTYRVSYVTKPAALTASGNPVPLPDGAERVLVESVAARVRARVEEDPGFHLRMRDQAWAELRDSLISQYLSTPQSVVCVPARIGYAFRFRGPATIDLTLARGW